MLDDDELDGCELDFNDNDPTPDDEVDFVALFAGASKAEAKKLAKEYRKLWGTP